MKNLYSLIKEIFCVLAIMVASSQPLFLRSMHSILVDPITAHYKEHKELDLLDTLTQRIIKAIKEENLEEIDRLLDQGLMEINDQFGEERWTPLHIAIFYEKYASAEHLIGKGADINAPAKGNWTPLQLAAISNDQAGIDLLLMHKADLNRHNCTGRSALYLVAPNCEPDHTHSEIASSLIASGAHVKQPPIEPPSQQVKTEPSMGYPEYFQRLIVEICELKIVQAAVALAVIRKIYYSLKKNPEEQLDEFAIKNQENDESTPDQESAQDDITHTPTNE